MNQPNNDADQRFDELLREAGRDVPQPALDEQARARLLAAIAQADARPAFDTASRSPGVAKWAAMASAAIAAVLVLACTLLWVELGRVNAQLARSRWETGEAFQLVLNARHAQEPIPVPEDLEGLSKSDLVLITFHHDLCPVARVCTPGFREMRKRHDGEPTRFITFDVTGSKRDLVAQEIGAMGMGFALLGPPGAETGVVKVLDATHQRVLCSAPGQRGLEQAELLLSRVGGAERRP